MLLIIAAGIVTAFIMVLNFNDDTEYYLSNGRKADAGVILAWVWAVNRPFSGIKRKN